MGFSGLEFGPGSDQRSPALDDWSATTPECPKQALAAKLAQIHAPYLDFKT